MRSAKTTGAILLAVVTSLGICATANAQTPRESPQAATRPLDKARTALVFVEFQEEWIGREGVLRRELVKDEAGMDRATAAAGNVLAAARASGWNVAHTPLDLTGDPSYLLFGRGEGKTGLAGAIPRLKTWQATGSRFVAPFVPREGEFVARGRSGASVLTNSTLDPYLRNEGIDTIVLMGFATHVCIESTMRQAHDMGLNVYVVTDGVAAFEPEQQAYFEKHVLHHFGRGITSRDLIAQMK